ncbi:MAG: glycosyltransferase family 9 protein [Terrimicrobiaceae bacterium]
MKSRLVVFEMHHLGDAVMALPFLRSAVKHFETTIFCRPGTAGFLEDAVPDLKVVPAAGWRSVSSALPRLGGGDAAACAWPDSRAHYFMRRSGAERRIGFRVAECNFYGAARPWRKRRLLAGRLAEKILSISTPLLTESLDRAPKGQTHGENWTQLAGALGFQPNFSFPWFPLPPPPTGFAEFLASSRAAGRKILALHPGGRMPGKRWPIERVQELLRGYLAQNKFAVAVIRPPGEECPEPCPPWQQIFETSSVSALGALFAATDGVLCNDSLASHLAAAVGVPVATIFGSGDPAWFAPYGNSHLVISTDTCRYRPCVDRCVMPSLVCLESVSIHLVERQLSAMFADPFRNPTL